MKNKPSQEASQGPFSLQCLEKGCVLRCLPLNVCQSARGEKLLNSRPLSVAGAVYVFLHIFTFSGTYLTSSSFPASSYPPPAPTHPGWGETSAGLGPAEVPEHRAASSANHWALTPQSSHSSRCPSTCHSCVQPPSQPARGLRCWQGLRVVQRNTTHGTALLELICWLTLWEV